MRTASLISYAPIKPQIRQSASEAVYGVLPGTVLPYAYDVPTAPRALSWGVEGAKAEKVVNVDKPYHASMTASGRTVYVVSVPDATQKLLVVTDQPVWLS
jgi:hypothetical protein